MVAIQHRNYIAKLHTSSEMCKMDNGYSRDQNFTRITCVYIHAQMQRRQWFQHNNMHSDRLRFILRAHTHLFHFYEERNSKCSEDILVKVGNWNQHFIICQVQLISWDFLYPIEYSRCNTVYNHIIL